MLHEFETDFEVLLKYQFTLTTVISVRIIRVENEYTFNSSNGKGFEMINAMLGGIRKNGKAT